MKKDRKQLLTVLLLLVTSLILTTSCNDDDKKTEQPQTPTVTIKINAVDLGLPSGTKWAEANLGAEKPQDLGLFYAWGETIGYGLDAWVGRPFDCTKYQWCSGSETTFTKYCTDASVGTVDNKTVLEAADDAATAIAGEGWRTPTLDDLKELIENTTSTWTTVEGVKGRKFTSKINGNSIFLPAVGYHNQDRRDDQNVTGGYWTSTLNQNSKLAYNLFFCSDFTAIYSSGRWVGISVRPVTNTATEYVTTAYCSGDDKTIPEPTAPVVKPVVIPAAGEAVDLGLPSGIKWASTNIGAENPEDYGAYFAWAETSAYGNDCNDAHTFYWAQYKWSDGSSVQLIKYNNNSEFGQEVDNKTTIELTDDAARVQWGEPWRMPTDADFAELVNNTVSEWTEVNGVKGRKFSSKTNDNFIFLPVAGQRIFARLHDVGVRGRYWTSTLYETSPNYGHSFGIGETYAYSYYDLRYYGFSIRPVTQ